MHVAAYFLSMCDTNDLESNPPDIGARHLLEDTSFFANDPSRHGNLSLEQSGTRGGTSAYFGLPMDGFYFL
jgi:hypothetical protein